MKTVRLENIVQIKKGKKVKSFRKKYSKGAQRYIQIDDLRDNSNVKYTRHDGVRVKASDVVIAWDGANAGMVGYGISGFAGSTIACLKILDKSFETAFVGKYLQAKSGVIRANCTGATIPHVRKDYLLNLRVPSKSIKKQRNIVREVDAVDSLRQKRKEQLALLDDYLKSVFFEMFGDPVKNNKSWPTECFEEIVAIECPLTYGIVQPGNNFKNGVPIVRPVDLTSSVVHLYGLKKIDPKIDAKYNRTRLNGGELLLSVRGATGVVAVAGRDLKGANVTRGLTPIWFSDKINTLFGLEQIKTKGMQSAIQAKTYGIALKQINLRDLRRLKFILPPIELQNKFASIVEQVEHAKQKMRESLAEMDNHFNALMQRYFG